MDVSHNDLVGPIPEFVSSLPHLSRLDFGCNPHFGDDHPSSLSKRSNLTTKCGICVGFSNTVKSGTQWNKEGLHARDGDEFLFDLNLPFWSQYEHHLLPFHGVVHIGYFNAVGVEPVGHYFTVNSTFIWLEVASARKADRANYGNNIKRAWLRCTGGSGSQSYLYDL